MQWSVKITPHTVKRYEHNDEISHVQSKNQSKKKKTHEHTRHESKNNA